MKTSFRVMSVIFVMVLTLSVVGPTSAANTWAVGNLVGLCGGTHIYHGPGGGYAYHTIVPEDNWTVKVINGPQYFNGEAWWDTSRFAAGDPSGGTGWVKQIEADSCSSTGGGGSNGGGDNGNGGGGEELPQKPEIKSRNDWRAVSPSSAGTAQSPNHIVIHHSRVDLNWKNYTLKELQIQYFILKDDFKLQNVVNTLNKYGNGYSDIAHTWPGLIWLIQADHMLSEEYIDIGYHYLIDPDGNIYEGRSGGEKVKGESVANANTGIIAINFLGDYEKNQPTEKSLTSAKKLIDWLVYQYKGNGLERNGTYVIPASVGEFTSCTMGSDILCTVPDISGHYQIAEKVGGNSPCPGENLKAKLPFLRGEGTPSANQYIASVRPNGMFIAMLSPAVTGIVDPIGRRLGIDPVTGEFVNEIPGGEFGHETIDDSGDNPFYLYIPEPLDGLYSIDINGTGNGAYHMTILDLESNVASGFADEITTGYVDHYQILYNTEKPAEFESFHDNEPPVTTIDVNGKFGLNGWYVTDAEVTLTAVDKPDDGAAGIKTIEYSLDNGSNWQTYAAPFVLSDGVYNLQYRAVDRVDNVEPFQSTIIKIDLVPPKVDVWIDRSEYVRTDPFLVHYSGYDPEPGSGLFTLTGLFNNQSVSNGQTVDLFWLPLDQYTLIVTGEDYAGWVTKGSESITLIATIPGLQQTVTRLCTEEYITKQGTCTSLLQKLKSALSAQQRDQKKTAVNILLAFQSELEAQKGKAVKLEAYNLLMMDSNYVITTLGGKK